MERNRLAGLTIPGLANCHSHAFHRALRGRTQRERGTFWTWREQMYAVAARLDPDSYYELARATYREMVAAGITAVGEFHYLHHAPDGTPYDDPNAMSHALVQAARDVGMRITLLDTCYLAAGIGKEPEGVQVRFSDGDAERWAERVEAADRACRDHPGVRVGAAIHSVRAVPTRPDEARRRLGGRARGAAARAPVRAGGGERRVPRGVRRDTHRGAGRRRRSRAAHQRRPRDPPRRRRHRDARRLSARTPASARPPSATSATASARRDACTPPALR